MRKWRDPIPAKLSACALAATMALAAPMAPAAAASNGASGGGDAQITAVSSAHRAHGSTRVVVRPRVWSGWHVGWGPYWGPTWGGYWGSWYGPYWRTPVAYPRAGARYGALDTDVSPERAEIWLDGNRIGVADDFDGFPDYLWLEEGTYDVVIYLPGFKTIARQYSIYPGLVIDVEDRLQRGESIHPLDLGPKSHERRDARIARDREQRERVEAERRAADERAASDYLDVRAEPGRLSLRIEPADASVYLDGRFVGTGGDLVRLRAGLLVDSGSHRVEVVRPGYRPVVESVAVEAGEETALAIALEPDDGRR